MLRLIIATGVIVSEENATDGVPEGTASSFPWGMPVAMFAIVGPDGILTKVNPNWQKVLGYTPTELTSRPFLDFVHPDDAARTAAEFEGGWDSQHGTIKFENRYRCKDGGYRWLSWVVHVPQDGGGVYCLATDITEQVAARDALADKERLYRMLAENASDVVFLGDQKLDIHWVSESITRIMGWLPEQLVGHSVGEFVHPDDIPGLRQAVANSAAGDRLHLQARWQCADGTYRWMAGTGRLTTDAAGNAIGRVVGLQDVHEQVLIQHELARNREQLEQTRAALEVEKERLELVLAGTRLGLWDWNMITGDLLVDERWAQIVGYRLEELQPTTIDAWVRLVHPEDLTRSDTTIEQHSAGLTPYYDIEVRMRHRDGRWVWVRDRGKIVEWTPDGRALRMTGTHEDVTELVHAREQVQVERARLRATMDSLPDPHMLLEAVRDESGDIVDFVFTDANPAACEYNGLAYQQLVGTRMREMLPGATGEGLLAAFQKVVETGEPLVLDDFAHTDERHSGAQRYHDARAVRVGDGLSFTWRDVTRHVLAARRELAESENRFQQMFDDHDAVMLLIEAETGEIVDANPAAARFYGYSVEQLRSMLISQINALAPEDIARERARALRHDRSYFTFPHRLSDGEIRTVEVYSSPVQDRGGPLLFSIIHDVTEQASARKALAESESRYRLLAENTTDIVWQLDLDDLIIWVSPSIEPLLGWRPDQLLGSRPEGIVHPGDREVLGLWRTPLFADTGVSTFELRMLAADGSYQWMSVQSRPTTDAGGAANGVVVWLRDIHQQVLVREYEAREHVLSIESASREQVARTRQLFSLAMLGASDGMAIVGIDLMFREVNAALCQLLSRSPEWLLEHGIADVVHPDDLSSDLSSRNELLTGTFEANVRQLRWVKANGSEIPIMQSNRLLRDGLGDPQLYMCHIQKASAAQLGGL